MLNNTKISSLRVDYKKHTLEESGINADPLLQFNIWFDETIKLKISEPNAMTLSTSTKSGRPSSRIVLLKTIAEDGLVFFTNYDSRKGKEIAENPNCAVLFFWKELERQVRIEGKVEKIPKKDSQEYFSSRPMLSRIGAIASPQSSVIRSRQDLEADVDQLMKTFKDKAVIPIPSNWGGYKLKPVYFEFWQGRENRLHDRLIYEKKSKKWKISRLAP
ncbi:pyridoxamine 5'-phosphate oxidase [soil metagenome]